MDNIVIRSEGLSKRYRIGERQRYKALRDVLTNLLSFPFHASKLSIKNKQTNNMLSDRTIWALKDVTFEVKRGEVMGIIGRNGTGKSTLLKILSRITEPTEGYAEVSGRVGSLLEIGTGFHPELTGRENIYLNGAILGMKKSEIRRKLDEIVDFAEIEKFIDSPVKFYSSGMYVRLAFSVAAHLESEILLVDEVLAVGDAAFQKKCLGKMSGMTKEGRTILFVSHNMGAIKALCSRALLLDAGRIGADGEVGQVVSSYLANAFSAEFQATQHYAHGKGPLEIRKVALKNNKGQPSVEFNPEESLTVDIHYYAAQRINNPRFWITVTSQYGSLFSATLPFAGNELFIENEGVISCTFPLLPLAPQIYNLRMGVSVGSAKIVPGMDISFFNVVSPPQEWWPYGKIDDNVFWDAAPLLLPYAWHLPDGKVIEVGSPFTKREKKELQNIL